VSTLERPCDDWLERLSAYLDGELTEADAGAVRGHLATCPGCRAWAEAVQADAECLRAAYGKAVATADVRAPVMGRVAALARAPRRTIGPLLWRLAGACVVAFIVVAALFPVFSRSKRHETRDTCISNQRQIAAAIVAFADDSDGRLPRADTWSGRLLPYLRDAREVFHCPEADRARNGGYDYAFNIAVSGKSAGDLKRPAATVMIFDADRGEVAWRHLEGAVFAYVDGHVKWHPRPAGPTSGEGEAIVRVPTGVQAVPAAPVGE
jgi:prepilin-type processing-associated H-X9-DG protein